MAPFLRRPVPGGAFRYPDNRRVAGELALTAELLGRLGRGVTRAQELFHAARELDRLPRDVKALAREGNLGVLTYLDHDSRRLVEEVVETGASPWVEELLVDYVEAEEEP
jgi:hypothetical protein